MAEIAGYFPHGEAARKFFRKINVSITAFDAGNAIAAGQIWRQRTHKDRIRILPDYIVASHAVEYADRLLTRDAGFSRMKVPGLVVVTPEDVLDGGP
jgi:predicted nucleic acid-binding protein